LLDDVREVWKRDGGLVSFDGPVSLQEKLLSYRSIPTEIKMGTIESGKVILKEKLHNKRVLLVLDNVDKLEQLKSLCGNRDWFGPGSKIIITTRDRHLLKEHRVDHIYKLKELDESESIELFNLAAFNQATTSQERFGELSEQLVAYSRGLTLE